MDLLEGIYQAKHPEIVEEKHGGVTLKMETYWSLCLYNTKDVGCYGATKLFFKPYFTKKFNLKGIILYNDDQNIKLNVYSSHNKENIIFEGEILEKKLRLKAYYESTPDKIWLYDEFLYIDLDYEKLKNDFSNS